MATLESPSTLNPTVLIPVNPKVEQYMLKLASVTDHPTLLAMEALAEKNNFPIVGRLVGVFLESLAKMICAQRVFEFGSGYGYSAYWFARGVGVSGKVICTDDKLHNAEQAREYLMAAGLWERVDFKTGIAEAVFEQTDGLYDICYNDVDKGDYPAVWQLAKDRIRPGGLYIADNVLWRGRVAVENYVDIFKGWTEAIIEHNQLVFNDPDFDTFINPTRDGVIVARRKTD
ncbi:MAG: O-methyltransferase [Methylococcaceae bacterium]